MNAFNPNNIPSVDYKLSSDSSVEMEKVRYLLKLDNSNGVAYIKYSGRTFSTGCNTLAKTVRK